MTEAPVVVLAADVGGTNTKLSLARGADGGVAVVKTNVYPSGAFTSLELAIERFLREPEIAAHQPKVDAACFAVAGPVEGGSARLTNLTWRIEEAALAQHFGIPRVKLMNDFAAAALGIDELAESDLLTLQAGEPVPRAQRVIVGAGTGLGVASLIWEGGRYAVHASEGGHSDFAPIDALQLELLRELHSELGHVSSERVLSGRGLGHILNFLVDRGATPGEPLLDALARGDPARAVTKLALAKRDEVAVQALDIFVSAYGAFAGNMALITLAHGGVYIAGGIAPKIAAKLTDGTFMRSFTAKGRFRALLETMPVKVVLDEYVGLRGALAEAGRLALG